MPLAEAAALAEHAGECFTLPHDPAADLMALTRLAEHCERFSPIVGWRTAEGVRNAECEMQNAGPDCLFLDVTGIGVLFGGEENLTQEVVADSARLGYEVRVAVADTIGATWALARQSASPVVQVPSTEYSALSALPIDSLRLSPETIDLLAQLGVTQLEQLLALPRESLRARFGEQLLLRIDQLFGTAQEMIVPYRPPPQFADEWLLEYPAEQREVIEQILQELMHRVARALADRREGVLRLSCRLDCVPGRPLFLEIGLFRPSADAAHLCDLVQMQLEQTVLPGPVGRLRLEATLTAPLENRQGELFAASAHQAARQFALLIDRCSSRLGADKVLCPELTADPLPERAVRYRKGVRGQESRVRNRRPLVRQTRNAERGTQFTPRSALLRPLTLHSPPLEIAAVSIAPDGPPVSFQRHGVRYDIVHQCGPERIETGWWRGKSVRRDYWRVETTTGQRFWLFRNLGDGKWYLHGEYA